MAVPKRKTTPSRRNMRRSHDALKSNSISYNKESGNPVRSHHIDLEEGKYNGRYVFTPKSKREVNPEADDNQSNEKIVEQTNE